MAQRQDSLTDQLVTVLDLATRAGCYDAADAIRRAFFEEPVRRSTGTPAPGIDMWSVK